MTRFLSECEERTFALGSRDSSHDRGTDAAETRELGNAPDVPISSEKHTYTVR
jgi:hypothetical protein